MESTADLHQSPFAEERSIPEAFAAGLELQPMLLGKAGDSSAVDAEATAAPVLEQPQRPAAPRTDAAEPLGLMAARRPTPMPAVPGKRTWHAAIRQRLKLRVRASEHLSIPADHLPL